MDSSPPKLSARHIYYKKPKNQMSIINTPKDFSEFFVNRTFVRGILYMCTSNFNSRLQSSHKYAFVIYLQATSTSLSPQFLS